MKRLVLIGALAFTGLAQIAPATSQQNCSVCDRDCTGFANLVDRTFCQTSVRLCRERCEMQNRDRALQRDAAKRKGSRQLPATEGEKLKKLLVGRWRAENDVYPTNYCIVDYRDDGTYSQQCHGTGAGRFTSQWRVRPLANGAFIHTEITSGKSYDSTYQMVDANTFVVVGHPWTYRRIR